MHFILKPHLFIEFEALQTFYSQHKGHNILVGTAKYWKMNINI